MTLEQLFDNAIPEPNSGCMLWLGYCTGAGYPQYTDDDGVKRTAHRVVIDCPDDKMALHSCDTPCCINPEHLRPGTQTDNMADRSRRGRARNQHTGKTFCDNGHELTEENTYHMPLGRACKECRREAVRRYRARQRG